MTDEIPTSDRHVDPTRELFDAFKALPRDEPVWMLNMVRFRERGDYPADHADAGKGRSGAEAYAEYARLSHPVFTRVGGSVTWRGVMQAMLIGPAPNWWDTIFIAHYPKAAAFLEMVTDPAYKLAVVHRQAAVLTSRLIRCQEKDSSGGFG
jgi:uncharacterized protein (DUF1330 family)